MNNLITYYLILTKFNINKHNDKKNYINLLTS